MSHPCTSLLMRQHDCLVVLDLFLLGVALHCRRLHTYNGMIVIGLGAPLVYLQEIFACRGGTLYIQGELGNVKVTASEDGGTYLGSSVHYPGDITSVDVQLSGQGSLIVATSSSESPLTHPLARRPCQDSLTIAGSCA